MSLEVLTQGGGTGGASASIFVTGLSEADVVTATKDGKTVQGKWVRKPNPAFVLPEGYTQFEYIEFTGTQRIDTLVSGGTNAAYEIVFDPLSARVQYEQYFAGARTSTIPKLYGGGAGDLEINFSSTTVQSTSEFRNKINTVSVSADGVVTHDGATVSGLSGYAGSGWGDVTWWIGNAPEEQTLAASMRLYSLKQWTDGILVRHLIPCGNPDGEIGAYDLVSEAFFPNMGTGTFLTGAEIPSVIDGHEITKIKDYGLWTVTATNGEDTATQDVLVDAAVDYEIWLGYGVYISDNFEGTTLDTDLWTWRADYTGECIVNNGVTVSNGSDASGTKLSVLWLNRPFTGKETRITVSLTATNITGTYKEVRIGMFTAVSPDGWSGTSSGLWDFCGLIVQPSTYGGSHLSVMETDSLTDVAGWADNNGNSFSFLYPTTITIDVDIENGTFAVLQDGVSKGSYSLPTDMENAVDCPFLFVSAQTYYAASISLSNVTVEIEY